MLMIVNKNNVIPITNNSLVQLTLSDPIPGPGDSA